MRLLSYRSSRFVCPGISPHFQAQRVLPGTPLLPHRIQRSKSKLYRKTPQAMADAGYDDNGSGNLAHLKLEDKFHGGQSSKKASGRGGGREGQGRDVQVSKALSRLLRHQAEKSGIKLDGEGYAPLDRVLAWQPIRSLGVTLPEVKELVNSNDKQRFGLKAQEGAGLESTDPAGFLIRANQGHSIKLDSSFMEALTPEAGNIPPRVVHGTYFAFWQSIVSSGGLRVMNRNHIHCSTGTPEEGVLSGMRKDAELLIEIDVERSIKEGGVKWWRSDNEVVLTEGDAEGLLSSRFFKLVKGRREDVGVLWEEGEKVADLPENLKIKPPPGKGPRGGGRGGRGQWRSA